MFGFYGLASIAIGQHKTIMAKRYLLREKKKKYYQKQRNDVQQRRVNKIMASLNEQMTD